MLLRATFNINQVQKKDKGNDTESNENKRNPFSVVTSSTIFRFILQGTTYYYHIFN